MGPATRPATRLIRCPPLRCSRSAKDGGPSVKPSAGQQTEDKPGSHFRQADADVQEGERGQGHTYNHVAPPFQGSILPR